MARQAHLVGSVGLLDAETVFKTVNDILGDCCKRIPDGETGERGYWIRWQSQSFENAKGMRKIEQDVKIPGFKDSLKRYFFELDGAPEDVVIPKLGYGDEALESWKKFKSLQDSGTIAADARFQVSLPTPTALLSGFVMMESRAPIEAAVEARMLEDLDTIQNAIPHDRLAIQWDVCYEVVDAENDGGPKLHYAPAIEESIKRIGALADHVAGDVEHGMHLCYGDPGHQHIVQPRDFTICVAFANGICAAARRNIDYIHMPVPRDRTDDADFAPLAGLTTPAETKIIVGLVHYTDGTEGGRARMATCNKYLKDYDIATECGFGRRDRETIPQLLKIHRELSEV